MDTAQRRTNSLFAKIIRICKDLPDDTSSNRVHQFRTTLRRIESLLNATAFNLTAKDRKLLQQLDEIRKRAGKLRDIDVQLAALRSLGLDRSYDQRKQVRVALEQRRKRRAAKVSRAAFGFSGSSVRKINALAEKLVKQPPVKSAEKRDYVALAMQQLSQAAREFGLDSNREISPDALHGFRLALKRVRYTAEIAGKIHAAESLVAQARRIQDAIGEWRDWENLTKSAEKELEGVQSSALISFLKNVTGAKLSTAMRTSIEVTSQMLSIAPKKVPGSVRATGRQSRSRTPLQA